MTALRRSLRRLRRMLVYGIAGLVIVAGLCVAMLGQLLPLLAEHPQRVAAWLGAQAGRPVGLSAVQAAWTRQGPRFDLHGLWIGEGVDRLDIGRAELQLDVYAGLLPGRSLTALQLTGPALELEHAADGGWRLQGLGRPAGASPAAVLAQLDAVGEIQLHNARLRVVDRQRGIDFVVPDIDARMRRHGELLTVGVLARIDAAEPLRFNLEVDPATATGRGYLGSAGLPLDAVRGLLPLDSGALADAELAGGLWFALQPDGIGQVRFDLQLDRLAMLANAGPDHAASAGEAAGGTPAAAGAATVAPVRIALPALQLDGIWRRGTAGEWQAVALVPLDDGAPSYAALQRGADGALQLELADWPLAPIARAAAEWPTLPAGQADWLRAAQPAGQLGGLRLRWRDGELQFVEGMLQSLAFGAVGQRPGLAGLSLDLVGDRDALDVQLAAAPLQFDWPVALLGPLQPQLSGRLQLFRDGDVPVLQIDQLALAEADYGFRVGGSLRLDGGRPSVDLRADVAPGPIGAASRFWVRHRMPPKTVAWLDRALQDGRIEGGNALLRGDLDDWPFEGSEGRFDAEARIRDTRLAFHPDWPAGEQLSGVARFIDDGMRVEAQGRLRGLDVPRAVARIAEFDQPLLRLAIDGHGSGPAILDVLRRSPLETAYGEHLAGLTIGGRGDIDLAMDLPLKPGIDGRRVDGTVRLHGAELADARWGIEFSDAEGPVRFSDRGLLADELAVRYGGQPARLGLAIGSFTSDPANVAEGRLHGRIDSARLLATAPSLDWLKPYWDGMSNWLLELEVPRADRRTPPTLSVQSDLVGTGIALPAPLAKADAVQMPLRLQVELSAAQPTADAADRGGRLDLQLGELLRLTGRTGGARRGFDGLAAFGTVAGIERPEQGLRVVGQVPVLDVAGWGALMIAGGGGGDGLIESLDLAAGAVDLADRSFAETRLQFERSADGGARVTLQGSALHGMVEIPPGPERATRGITGRFERLHWPEPRAGAPGLAAAADPAALPPLHVWIGDLQIGDARLGDARLETFPVEHGMRIERFESRSPALELFARGDWARRALGQQSDFTMEFTAPDLGAMLRALGFEALIDGGQTLARLQASWPGGPSAFSLDAVDGWLEVSVGKGRIPKVNPGGVGRVFGLLSLSEIPRRLSLDFTDFFRAGLAFNRIEGRFELDDGNARTDDLLIDGPAAEIHIRGRTGLGVQDYAQTMEVLPRAGNVLPVVGALAGGPAGAAIGAFAQAVLSKPFKQMTRTLYKVEGSWDDPVIEVLERGPARPPEIAAQADPLLPERPPASADRRDDGARDDARLDRSPPSSRERGRR